MRVVLLSQLLEGVPRRGPHRARDGTAAPRPERPSEKASEVGELIGSAPRTVKQFAYDGRLPRVVLGHRSTRYRLSDVLALIEASTSEAPAGIDEGFAKTSDHGVRHAP